MAQNPLPHAEAKRPVFHGRRHGRRLRPAARENLAWGLAAFGIAVEHTTPIDMATLFGDPLRGGACDAVFLEIGFGGGEHLAARALAAPDDCFIGAEPFISGIAKLCGHIRKGSIKNIRIFPDDIRLLLPRLPDKSLAGVYILFPDPWPKRRHRTRRILSPGMLAELCRLIRPGGSLLLASDDATAKTWLLSSMLSVRDAFRWHAKSAAGWRHPPEFPGGGELFTRYRAKAEAAGRRASWFAYTRIAEGGIAD